MQNPPNSPDLAYPTEDLWGIIKPRVKTRNPQSVQELKKFIIEEWNSIPQALIKNLCSGFIGSVKKVLELNGSRLKPEHLKKPKENIIFGKHHRNYHQLDMFTMTKKFLLKRKRQ